MSKNKTYLVRNTESVASRNLTRMVLMGTLFFVIGNVPNGIVYILQQFYNNNGIFYRTCVCVGNMLLFATQGSDILVYYNTNKMYKKRFYKIFGLNFTD